MRWAVRQGIHYPSAEGVIPRTIARVIEEGPSPTGDMDRDVRQQVALPELPVPTATGLASWITATANHGTPVAASMAR